MMNDNAVAAIANLAVIGASPKANPNRDGDPFVIIPHGHDIHYLKAKEVPGRNQATVNLFDCVSFSAYVAKFCGTETIVYGDGKTNLIVAVMNDIPENGKGNWRDWRAILQLNYSDEWLAWLAANRRQVSQVSFAEFIEDHIADIVLPDGASLLEMALNFEDTKSVTFKSARRLRDGAIDLQWVEDNSAGSAKIPSVITVAIPVFRHGPKYEINARVKYRVADGKLTLWYELIGASNVSDAAFESEFQRAGAGLSVLKVRGSP